ncbi:sensor histidine kinase [Caulobacter sp. FWC2]|uniref:sensor histidine kinase n=1 Tax=Caulobacter sp. FWC2 TaxID=69664 RepID=UPI000C1614D7|nr:PAS domain-containing sensor histidine kinase [Caulobacter sp. FWC2]PIB93263.1 histidine kinase [Caulobacter sp. FWC2]
MAAHPILHVDAGHGLAMAIIATSAEPTLLLDNDMVVIAASTSFCRAFEIDPARTTGLRVADLGAGEWDVPQLRSLLKATASGKAKIAAYEMDLVVPGRTTRQLVLNAEKLQFGQAEELLILAMADVTDLRLAERVKDNLLVEKATMLKELQHRVANSLQIIASVLLQSARRVQSDETRDHLRSAHHRVMSVAAVQRQLATTGEDEVRIRAYLTELCESIGASMIRDPALLKLTVEADASVTSSETSVSLGLIVTELVINALKHGFPGDRGGAIKVAYHAQGASWRLSVADDGVGIPDAEGGKPGLGTSIVRALATQLKATVKVVGTAPGTTVLVEHEEHPDAAQDKVAPIPLFV